MRVGTHAASAIGSELSQFRNQFAGLVKKLLRFIAAHPIFQNLQMGRISHHVCDRNLVGPPEAFQLMPTYPSGRRPPLWRTQNNHWPATECSNPVTSCSLLSRLDLFNASIQRRSHRLMHTIVVRALNEIRFVSIADKEMFKIFMADPRQDRRIVNFIPVEMK